MRRSSRPVPRNPFRDSALLYTALALVIVIVAVLTGGSVVFALVVALVFFVLATAYSWWRFRARATSPERRGP